MAQENSSFVAGATDSGAPGASAAPGDPADRLLGYLRARLDRPALGFAAPPRRLRGGVEASILAFRLLGAPPPFDVPLVLRRFRFGHSGVRAPVEAGIHDAAREAGLPVPRCLLHESDRRLLGGAFVVLERVEGASPSSALVADAAESGLRARTLWRSLLGAPRTWRRVPGQLVEAALRVATVDAGAVEEAVRKRGGHPEFLSVDARLDRIERRIDKYGLRDLLAPSLAWLAAHRPPAPARPCLVHGDLGPTNALVRDGRIVGLLDWSKALLAEPEAEVGFLRIAIRTTAISGLGRWNPILHRPLVRVAERLTRRYEAERHLDPERVRWYEVLRAVGLTASMAKRAKPGKPRRHVLDADPAERLLRAEIARLTDGG